MKAHNHLKPGVPSRRTYSTTGTFSMAWVMLGLKTADLGEMWSWQTEDVLSTLCDWQRVVLRYASREVLGYSSSREIISCDSKYRVMFEFCGNYMLSVSLSCLTVMGGT